MKSIILVLVFVYVAAAYELEDYTWAGFKKIHNRTYVGEEERMRKLIFEDNLRFIEEFNAQGHSYTVGVNRFADMTNLEYRQMMLGFDNEARLSKKPDNQNNYHVYSMDADDLPAKVDWRKKGIVTPMKDQGQCGSCWAFSTTGCLEGQYALKNGKLDSFSEQELVDCSTAFGNHGCQGGLMDNAYRYLKNHTEELNVDYKYTAENGKCKYDESKGVTKVKSYVDIKSGDILGLKDASANIGPISVAMDASHISLQLYLFGVYDPEFCSSTKLDHGVLVVGYGHDELDGKDYWEVKNSWGTYWGVGGYFKIAMKKNKCGICTSASYAVL
ncbi:Cathepsin L [Oopsacas minuta]|uniref:Cathepsin L n=1 Tax=Oopsacas minuta TaxID=111878 RepID=A0AAV7JKZ9_9METZ|nr:Cathepsin L [Oopsacas minuta]